MTRTGKFVVNKLEKLQIQDKRINTSKPLGQVSLVQKLEFVLMLINRLLIGFITFYLLWMCLRLKRNEIPWHAVCCTLGFVSLMAEGLMAHYRGNAWTQLCHRTEKTRTHWILQLCGSLIGLIGIGIKMLLEEVHFHTTHGILGLATLILMLMSLVSGLSALYANELRARLQPLLNKAFHNTLGLLTFTLAMLSMYTSLETDIFIEHSLDAANYVDFRLLLQSVLVFIFILSSYGPLWCLIYSKLWKCC